MIPVPSGVRVWLATGVTDMRRGMNTLALQVQESLGRDPHAGDFHVFRGRRGDLLKILWHDGVGVPLYTKRLAPPQVECAERQSVCRAESASGLTGSFEPLDQFLPLRGDAPRPMLRTACPRHDFIRLRVLGSGE